jgi:hypothetical protein
MRPRHRPGAAAIQCRGFCWHVGVWGERNGDFYSPPTGFTPNCAGWTAVSIPIAIDGTLVGDGHGVLTGTQTFNAGGLTCSGTLKGTYTVAVDGTGTLNIVTFTPNPGSPPQCTITVGNTGSNPVVDANEIKDFLTNRQLRCPFDSHI